MLRGLGDAQLGEWVEIGRIVHVRRRLSADEQAVVGPARDLRGTAEAAERASALGNLLQVIPAEVLARDLTK